MNIQLPTIGVSGTPDERIDHIISVYNDTTAKITEFLLRVPRAQFVTISAPAVADTAFIVKHSLGVRPAFASVLGESDLRIYSTLDDQREWSAVQIKIRCTAANKSLIVKVEK